MRPIQIPPYLPLVAEEAVKRLEERIAEVKAMHAGKLLLDKPARRITRPKSRGR
ncbi:MAG: hypothetical protein ACO3C4_01625 [Candidatus Limnocylindrus sp.]